MNYIYTIIFCLLNLCSISQNLEWAKAIGSPSHDGYSDIYIAENNDIISFGFYTQAIDLDPGSSVNLHTYSGGMDVFIQRLDGNGNYKWSKSFGNGGNGSITAMTEDKYGNLYFTGGFDGTYDFDPDTGVFNLTAVYARDYFVLKLDSNGNFLWVIGMGGSSTDQGLSIEVDNNLNIYTSGVFSTTVDFDPKNGVYNLTSNGLRDAFIQKLDSAGNLVWAYSLGGTYQDDATNLRLDKVGNICVSGTFSGNVDFDFGLGVDTLTGNGDVYILKIDTNGIFDWVKYFNGPSVSVFASDMEIDKNGNIYIVGGFGYNNFPGGSVVDFDPSNSVLNYVNSGEEDIFEVSLDPQGDLRWVNKVGTAFNERGMSVAIDDIGVVYFTGTYEAPVDFDTGPGVEILPNTSNFGMYSDKIYMHAVDTGGGHLWAITFGGTPGQKAFVGLDSNSKIYVNGSYNGGGGDFDPNSGGVILPSNNSGGDGFVLKLNSYPVGIKQETRNNNLILFPNPAVETLNILSKKSLELIEILNLSGQVVFREKNPNNKINISKLSSGAYIVKVISNSDVLVSKFIKK